MKKRTQDLVFAACGIGYVVAAFGGAILAMGTGKTHSLLVSSTPSEIAAAVAKPAGTGVWVGAYLELAAVGLFVAFAVWAAAKLGDGLLGSVARGAAVANAGATVVSLGVGDALSYRAGRGIGLDAATTLVTLNQAIYVGTWFLTALFLVAAGCLALAAARRALGWSAIAIAVYTLATTAVSYNGVGQFGSLFAMVWIVAASVALARSRRMPVARTAPQAA